LRKLERIDSESAGVPMNEIKSPSEKEMIIEKAGRMEVHTAAGHYAVDL
jgi:hypothetical protein